MSAAGNPKVIKGNIHDISMENNTTVVSVEKRAQLKNGLAKASDMKAADTVEKTNQAANIASRADETSDFTLLYTYPDGAYFPYTSFYQQGESTPYYSLRNAMLISPGETIFPNYTFKEDGNSLILVENADWKWTFTMGDFQDLMATYTSSDLDLKAFFVPCPVLNNPMDAPVLEANGQSYVPNVDGYKSSILVGGNGNLNPGLEKAYNEQGRYDFSHTAMLFNFNSASSFQDFADPFMAGKSGEYFNDGLTGDGIRNDALATNLTQLGIDKANFYGLGQMFYTGTTETILSYIELRSYVAASKDDEVVFTLYKLNPSEDGESVLLENVYEGYYIVTEDGLTKTGMRVETTTDDQDYLTLEPNSTYFIAISGFEQFDLLAPDVIGYTLPVGEYIPEWFMRKRAFALYFSDNGIEFVPTDVAFRSSTPNAIEIYPSMSFKLGITLPYITPAATYTSLTDGKLLDPQSTECDIEFFSVDGIDTPVSQVVVISDASVEALTASIQYSTEELKNNLRVVIIEGDALDNGTVQWTSAERNILLYAQGDIPANSYIKINNYGQSFTINLPAHDMSGIGDVVADGEAVATEYFDLQGRKLAGEANGVVIKKMTMADGSVKAVKVVK